MSSLLKFFLLAYAVMWACFITVAAVRVPAHTPLGTLLLLFGTFAPGMAALWFTARSEGGRGVQALLARMFQWRVSLRWYLFAISYIAIVKLVAALLYRTATGGWPRFGDEPLYLIPVAILVSTPFQMGEEIGWRGYALPRLAARFGLARASIILGLIWACWHVPQFFIAEADTYRQSFIVYLLEVTALSVAMAWLWERSGRSLLLTMLMHAAVNNSKDIVPSAVPVGTGILKLGASPIAWLTVMLLWTGAAYFLSQMRKIPVAPILGDERQSESPQLQATQDADTR